MVYYYSREKLWRQVFNTCKEGEKRFGDPFFTFWKAYSIYREGNPSQAVTEIQKIESKRELQWASIRASIFFHNKCKNVDTATVDSLAYMERDFSKNPSERAVVAAAYFEIFNGDKENAEEILNSTHYDSPIMSVVRGWFDVYFKDEDILVEFINCRKDQGNTSKKLLRWIAKMSRRFSV
jgi:hypothetical protein